MRYALDGIRRRPGRSLLAMFGIGLASALLVALLALSEGIDQSTSRLAVESGIDLLATSANTTITGGVFPPVTGAHRLVRDLPHADANVASASPWLVNDLVFANASLRAAVDRSPNGSAVPAGWGPSGAGSVGWIPGANVGLDAPAVVSGAGFSSASDLHYANGSNRGPFSGETVLDLGLAAILHAAPGDTVWVSPRTAPSAAGLLGWYANATAFRVVGLSGAFWLLPSALLGFFYLSELQSIDGGPALAGDYASFVLMHLANPVTPKADQATLGSAFPTLRILTIGNILGAVSDIVSVYRTFGTLVGAVGVAVATLFTSAVLLMSVEDRTQEIALLRAIGYTRRTIGRFVLEEAALLCGFGLAIGLPMGAGIAFALNYALARLVSGVPTGFRFVIFDGAVVAAATAVVVAIGIVAALVPMARAVTGPIASELRAA
ncbi:MAG: ABC transporter permease [Thermoplasmata archaeon]|nr:ABC transporter permease [Thermoplasmata archaeon]